jgi:CRP/FNR family cyclic AMP-dependent transcriptional regulator
MGKRGKADFVASGFSKRDSSTFTRQYGDHETVFVQGAVANSIFCVQQGHVKLTMTSKRRKDAAIAILGAGDCFGEGCLNGNSLRAYSATSIHQSTINEVSKRSLALRLKTEPALAQLFMSYLLVRIDRAHDDMAALLVSSSEKRLARLLLQLSGFGTASEHSVPMADIDQGTLAQVVGTTRSRVSHFMNQFRKKGFIDYNGSLRVNKGLRTFLHSPDSN